MKTIIDITTNQVIGATYSNECLETQVLIDELLQVVMVKPYFNFDTREFYEGATPAEIEQAFKDKTPSEVQLWRLRTILNLMKIRIMYNLNYKQGSLQLSLQRNI